MQVGSYIWAIYHPQRGYLSVPVRDKIKDTYEDEYYLLEKLDFSASDTDWDNDFYGNLIHKDFLFLTCEDAISTLVDVYSIRKSKAFAEFIALEEKINKLLGLEVELENIRK